jgi:hypothetical protein
VVSLPDLWLPILLAAVLAHFAGFLMWMVLPHHRGDWRRLPNEDALAEALRAQGAGAGQYNFPHCDKPEDMKDPAWLAKMERGPTGFLILGRPHKPSVGPSLVQYMLYTLAVSLCTAYVASRTVSPGAEYLQVFRVTGTVATLAYAGALPVLAIWFSRTWGSIAREMLDGLVFGLLTAGVFGWLWPAAVA